MSTTIQKRETDSVLAAIIEVSKGPDSNIDALQKLVDLHLAVRAEERQEELSRAIATLEPKLTTLVKSKSGAKTKSGDIKYWYTPFEDIDRMLRPLLRECGLSLSFSTREIGGKIFFVAQVQEVKKGGVREALIPYAPDTNDQLGGPQKVASGLSYAKRISVALLFNLVFEGEDDDGVFADAISAAQVGTIERLLTEREVDREAFLNFVESTCGVRDIALIPERFFIEFKSKLEQKKLKQPEL